MTIAHAVPDESQLGPGGHMVLVLRSGDQLLLSGIYDAQGQPIQCLITQNKVASQRSVLGLRAPQSVRFGRIKEPRQ